MLTADGVDDAQPSVLYASTGPQQGPSVASSADLKQPLMHRRSTICRLTIYFPERTLLASD